MARQNSCWSNGKTHVEFADWLEKRAKAFFEPNLSLIKWILRRFADSWNGPGEAENAPLLTKQIGTFSTVELLFSISKLAQDP